MLGSLIELLIVFFFFFLSQLLIVSRGEWLGNNQVNFVLVSLESWTNRRMPRSKEDMKIRWHHKENQSILHAT